ncbi:hypothetical protein ILUMI_17156 [Ignelater luminosus]|uniref:Uncharacterized protein n=1 Tax=Ignelater luminosus TaxID=2038154 RepID=A0A8K0G5A8_IGNLU|nr:hypothetical protein ILUMI_17156 [Ignelater luminosus]
MAKHSPKRRRKKEQSPPNYGDGELKGKAEGAKKPGQRSGRHRQDNMAMKGKKKLYIATYNVRTLSSEEKLVELINELENIKWDIVSLSEAWRRGEELSKLKSGHAVLQMP